MGAIFRIKRFAQPLQEQAKIQQQQLRAAQLQLANNIALANLGLRKLSIANAQANVTVRLLSNAIKLAKIVADQNKLTALKKIASNKGAILAKVISAKSSMSKHIPGYRKLTTPIPPKSVLKR